jgi:ubiquinone/menaquinone biosynthesis C-methylase UbiE
MLRQSLDALARSSPRFRRLMMRTWYEALVVIDREKQITFMNYGYADLEPAKNELDLSQTDEPNRYAIQMYHHVASAIDLFNKNVVEIGSGRGGGAAYVARTFKPKSMLGIDMSSKAVHLCNKYCAVENLSFTQGDAECIPLPDNSADVIMNIESSHCYGSMVRFVKEVHRVLKPEGHFLLADHRDADQVPLLRGQLEGAGLQLVTESDITPMVVKALQLDDARKQKLIGDSCPWWLRSEAAEFAAMVGTRTYDSFDTSASRYLSLRLRKRS